jgi:hypothetical protein
MPKMPLWICCNTEHDAVYMVNKLSRSYTDYECRDEYGLFMSCFKRNVAEILASVGKGKP